MRRWCAVVRAVAGWAGAECVGIVGVVLACAEGRWAGSPSFGFTHVSVCGIALQGALHVKQMAEHYGVPVVLHSDHCAHKLLPWFDGMLEADEKHFKEHGTPLFSSHMLDLSEEPHEENIKICTKYLERMVKINCFLEMEIGITGGEEDGVNNENAKAEDLYSKPEEVWQVVESFNKVPNSKNMFSIAAAFGNVHGVYKAGNVKLSPEILGKAQTYSWTFSTHNTFVFWYLGPLSDIFKSNYIFFYM